MSRSLCSFACFVGCFIIRINNLCVIISACFVLTAGRAVGGAILYLFREIPSPGLIYFQFMPLFSSIITPFSTKRVPRWDVYICMCSHCSCFGINVCSRICNRVPSIIKTWDHHLAQVPASCNQVTHNLSSTA